MVTANQRASPPAVRDTQPGVLWSPEMFRYDLLLLSNITFNCSYMVKYVTVVGTASTETRD